MDHRAPRTQRKKWSSNRNSPQHFLEQQFSMNYSPDVSPITCCDHVYERPSGRPLVSDPATYCSSTPRVRPPAVARWHTLLHGLATAIREISGLGPPWSRFPDTKTVITPCGLRTSKRVTINHLPSGVKNYRRATVVYLGGLHLLEVSVA